MLRERRRPLGEFATARTTFQTGRVRTTLLLATGGTYNRIEGLPIVFGPTFEFRPSPTTVGAARPARHPPDRGRESPAAAATSATGPGRAALPGAGGVGGPALQRGRRRSRTSRSRPSENGWSAFLLQRDYRDYFERRGRGRRGLGHADRTLRFEVSLRRDHERSVRATDPWSLFRNSDRWRRNPLHRRRPLLHHRRAQVDLDTRNDRELPSTGWLLRGRYEHSTSDDVAPVLAAGVGAPPSRRPAAATPSTGSCSISGGTRGSPLRCGSTPGSAPTAGSAAIGCRSSAGSRSAAPTCCPGTPSAPSPAPRAGSPTRPSRRSATARSRAQLEVRTRLGLNLGYPAAVTREGERRGRFIGIEEADLVFLGDAGKAWLAGDGPGQVPVNRIPCFHEWKRRRRRRARCRRDRRLSRQEPDDGEPVEFVVRLQRRF